MFLIYASKRKSLANAKWALEDIIWLVCPNTQLSKVWETVCSQCSPDRVYVWKYTGNFDLVTSAQSTAWQKKKHEAFC